MAKTRRPRRSTIRSRKERRHSYARRRQMRRRSDFYVELGKLAGLIGTVCIAILGQAELIGEPMRHYVTVMSIIAVAVWGYCMHPQTVAALVKTYKLMRQGKAIL